MISARGTYQSVTILGRLTKDPETIVSKAGKEFMKFSLATAANWGKDQEEKTKFWDCLHFSSYLKSFEKGDRIMVEGHVVTDMWTDADGRNRYSDTLIADNVMGLGRTTSKTANTPPAYTAPNTEDDLPF